MMKWNWQQPEWPEFTWRADLLQRAEEQFLVAGGMVVGELQHLDDEMRQQVRIAAMSDEAVTSSEIEGELLDRESVQSSIRQHIGLATTPRRTTPAERGIAEMMVSLYATFAEPLEHDTLWGWHEMLMRGRDDLTSVGSYRTHTQPMQVVSGRMYEPTVHFEAPPSSIVGNEMSAFIDWFNETAPTGSRPLAAITRAGVAHLYFESVHPFEDGNGRIGRAVSEKALAQGLGRAVITALASSILAHRNAYYDMLELSNKGLSIDEWLRWFGGVVLEAQQRTQRQVLFLIEKSKLLDRVHTLLNDRQQKVLLRVLAEGPKGFEGGLSAGNYVSITKTSPATARRDLADLVARDVFVRSGERRHARYRLNITIAPLLSVEVTTDGRIAYGEPLAQ